MAARAIVREDGLALIELAIIDIGCAARRVLELVGLRGLEEEQRHIGRLVGGRLPIGRVLIEYRDEDRRNLLTADQQTEMTQPFLAEQPDIDEHAVERS